MSLRIFNALSASGIQQPSVRYPWDDWRENRELRAADQTVVARLNEISRRAVLAYACGSAEWMVYRFTGLTDTQKAWDFLEASWAMIVHLRYGTGAESWSFAAEEGWEGPVRDPIRRCLEYLEAAIYSAYSDDDIEPAVRASKIVKLVMYVMPNPGPYQEWSERILTRLEALYPRDPAVSSRRSCATGRCRSRSRVPSDRRGALAQPVLVRTRLPHESVSAAPRRDGRTN